MPTQDELSPTYIGQPVVTLALVRPPDERRPALKPITLSVAIDPTAKMPDGETFVASVGLSLPLEMTVTAPTKRNFQRKNFQRGVPTSVTFTPREPGRHLVRLRELGHNRWFGVIVVVVDDA